MCMISETHKIPVGILGATGMVGQRFVSLLSRHPWFEIVALAASERSAGKTYGDAVDGRWHMPEPVSEDVRSIVVQEVERDKREVARKVRCVFSALDLSRYVIRRVEEEYAAAGVALVSNNSAHRWTEDVPMIMPEVNPDHLAMIDVQRKRRGWTTGCIVVKPNCSLQSFVPVIHALKKFEVEHMIISTYQALSGAGKTLASWPEMQDNVAPYISGEEEKSEKEPMKVLGTIEGGEFKLARAPLISATCIRVPVSDGHMAVVSVKLKSRGTEEQLIKAFRSFENPLRSLGLPSAPEPFMYYFDEEGRPQTRLDRDIGGGMAIAVGRVRPDPVLDWKFVALSHNTIRGAAGGAILVAELMIKKRYIV